MIEVHVRHGEYSREAGGNLTAEGIRQAQAAHEYIRANFPGGFDIALHSERRCAEHTAEYLAIDNIKWLTDGRLNEATWPTPWPTDFKAYRGFYTTVSGLCQELDQTNPVSDRLIVSHGGVMQMVRAYREGFTGSRFKLLKHEP